MARLTIQRMVCDNFKNFKHIEFEFGKDTTNISGRNGSGKTSIADAFTWVLFNKSARGDAPGSDNFRDKPLDEHGAEVHYLTTSVELSCELDGTPITLKREQNEKWERIKGSTEQNYRGNVSTYYINGVETKLADFKAKIAQICAEDVFKYIASLSAFNQAEWKKRRTILLSMHKEPQEEIVKPEFAEIYAEAKEKGMTVAEYKLFLSSECKRLANEQKLVPARIDEVRNGMPKLDEQTIKDALYTRDETTRDIENVNTRIAELKTQTPNDEIEKKAELEKRLKSMKDKMKAEHDEKRKQLINVYNGKKANLDNAFELMTSANAAFQRNVASIENLTRKRLELVSAYKSTYAQKLPEVVNKCPTCGQVIPQEMVEIAKAEAENKKNAALKEIESKGVEVKASLDAMKADNEKLGATANSTTEAYKALVTDVGKLKDEITAFPAEPNYDSNEDIAQLQRDILVITRHQQTSDEDKIASLISQRNDLSKRQQNACNILYEVDAWNKAKQRIEALENYYTEIGATMGDMEQKSIVATNYLTAQCAEMEDAINANFANVSWKLFDTAINGTISDCCTCMIRCGDSLIPYESANTASKANADIDIVNALSRYYGTWMPLFVDNAETVLNITNTDTQMIALYVKDCDLIAEKKG